jgi:hypothetical protein
MGKAMGILMLVLVSAIVIPMILGVSLSTNTTGWNPIMVQLTTNYLPLLAGVVVLVAVIGGIAFSKRG